MENSNTHQQRCCVVQISDKNIRTGITLTLADAVFMDFDSAVKYAESRFNECIENGVCGRTESRKNREISPQFGFFKAKSVTKDELVVEVNPTVLMEEAPVSSGMPVITW